VRRLPSSASSCTLRRLKSCRKRLN
jgi:hypothetical protein